MPALDSTGADRIAPFGTLWDSYTGADSTMVAALFTMAADILEREGYDRYSKEDDETSSGLTIFEVLKRVASDQARADAARFGIRGDSKHIDRAAESLADELAARLGGVLLVTGAARDVHRNGLDETLWHWTRESIGYRRASYRGKEHAVRLLKVAAAMTMAVEAAPAAPAAPEAPLLDGCTCTPVAGSHRPWCAWTAR